MASAISYEFYSAKRATANGLATLDASSKLPVDQLPDVAIENYKGEYADETALTTAYTSASLGDYAYVTDTSSYWYWNDETTPAAWVNQQISEAAYNALTAAEKAAVPYIVVS